MSSIFVDRFYEMDPEFDDVIFGSSLREGMVVLLEDRLFRGDPERMETDKWERAKCREVNRWATVTDLKLLPRPEYGSPLVRFIALYGDGTKSVRTYDASYAWLVKKASLVALNPTSGTST